LRPRNERAALDRHARPAFAKGRARFGKNNIYTPGSTRKFEHDLGWVAKIAMKGRGPIFGPVSITVRFEISGSPTSKRFGDLDNLCKAALDALNGIAFFDDCQIVSLHATKVCSSTPRTVLTITDIEATP
jgi:Holliday junction resolvase RusA-like endonuclease